MRYEVEINGRMREVIVRRAEGRFGVTMAGREWIVDAGRVNTHTLSLMIGQASHEVTLTPGADGALSLAVGGTVLIGTINGTGSSGSAPRPRAPGRKEDGAHLGSGPQRLVAPMPGKILRVLVERGAEVRARQPLVVVEAMKMENELRAARAGTVTEIAVRPGQSVDAGALLAVIASDPRP